MLRASGPALSMCITVRKAGERFISGQKKPADLTSLGVKTTPRQCSFRCYHADTNQITQGIFEAARWERHGEPHLRDEDAEPWKSLKCAQNHSWQVASTRFKSRPADSKYCLNSRRHCPN